MNIKNITLAALLACGIPSLAHETVNLNFDWKFGRGDQPGAESAVLTPPPGKM